MSGQQRTVCKAPAVPRQPKTPDLPAWGVRIREHREQAGLTIAEAARRGGISDSFWGQVEKGYQRRPDGDRLFTPAVGVLLHIARSLRLSDDNADELIRLAGYPPLPTRRVQPARGFDLDTSGLLLADVRALQEVADRLREARAEGHSVAPA